MLRLKVTPVVGLPQFTGWSQVAESTASVSVRLIVVYAISGKHAGNVGRDISEKVSDFYFYDIEQLHDFLQQLVVFAHSNECKIYFSCAVLGRSKSIFATYGGSIFLKRGEKSGRMLMSDYQVKIVEGNYLEDDTFVLTTLQADQFLSEIQLKFQQGYDTDIIITSVVPGLHAQDDSSLSALVFITKDTEKIEALEQLREEEAGFIAVEDEPEFDGAPSAEFGADSDRNMGARADIGTDPDLNTSIGAYAGIGADSDINTQAGVSSSAQETVSAKEKLAQIEFAVDPITVPSSLSRPLAFVKQHSVLGTKKALNFFSWLVLVLKNFSIKLFRTIQHFDFQKMSTKIKQLFSKKPTYVTEVTPKKGLWKLIIGALLIIAVLSGIGFISYTRNQEEERIRLLLEPIQTEFVLAKTQSETDVIAARETISRALETVSALEKANETSTARAVLAQAKTEMENYLNSISGQEELQELDIFYDLRLAKSDFISTGIDSSDNKLVLFDKEMKQILLLDHDTKQVSLRDFSDREVLQDVVLLDQTVFVLVDGIYKFSADLDTQTQLETVRELGDSNRNALLIDAYDRFVYVVNPEKRNIYRYSQTEEGYSEPIGWMKSATGLRYDEIRSIAIDGMVWLTTSDGQIRQFASGREESFNIRGLEVPFERDIYVYTNASLENLHILDPSNNRVVILSKTGDFIKEFKSVSLGAASNITVSEELGKIFVISGSIIYQIEL